MSAGKPVASKAAKAVPVVAASKSGAVAPKKASVTESMKSVKEAPKGLKGKPAPGKPKK